MKNCIYLSNNDVCPIGPKYKNNLLEVINNYEYNTKDNEYAPFKALLDLKEAGKHYNLEAISYK